LKPGQKYTLWLTTSRSATAGKREALVTFTTNIAGAQVAQAIAPLRQVLVQAHGETNQRDERHFLVVTEADNSSLVLVQSEIQP
jgi:hypothetical protein